MELPQLFVYSGLQRRMAALWMVLFFAASFLAFLMNFQWHHLWLQLFAVASLAFALVFWNLYRKRLARIVVDETCLVYSEPGWRFWRGPAKVLVFPYQDSTLHIRWPRDKTNPIPFCAVTSGADSLALLGLLPHYMELVQHLRNFMPDVDEREALVQGKPEPPLDSGVILHYGKVGRTTLILGVMFILILTLNAMWTSKDSWPAFVLDTAAQLLGGAFLGAAAWLLGPRITVDAKGISYQFVGIQRRADFADLEKIAFRNGMMVERMALHAGETAITVYSSLSRYEELVQYLEAKRPESFPQPEVQVPWVVVFRAISIWQQRVILGVWTVIACGVLYLIQASQPGWPAAPLYSLGLLALVGPVAIALLLYDLFRFRQFEFGEDRIVLARRWRPKTHPVKDLLRIEYSIKAMEHQRLTFHLRGGRGEFHMNASQVRMPLRLVLRSLHVLYPATRQAERADSSDDVESLSEVVET